MSDLTPEVLEFGSKLCGCEDFHLEAHYRPWATFGMIVEAMEQREFALDLHSFDGGRTASVYPSTGKSLGPWHFPNPAIAALLAAHAALGGQA